jgi:hypothetical protein
VSSSVQSSNIPHLFSPVDLGGFKFQITLPVLLSPRSRPRWVFDRLKDNLLIGTQCNSPPSAPSDGPLPLGHIILCKRCLGPSHGAKACSRSIRCWYCFGYDHVRRICFRWLSSRRTIWKPKVSNAIEHPSRLGLEQCTDPVEGSILPGPPDPFEEMANQFLECQPNQQQQPPPTPSQEPVEMLFDDNVDQSSSVIQDQSSSFTSVNQEQSIVQGSIPSLEVAIPNPLIQQGEHGPLLPVAPLGNEPGPSEPFSGSLQSLTMQFLQVINISGINLNCSINTRERNLALTVTLEDTAGNSQNLGLQLHRRTQQLAPFAGDREVTKMRSPLGEPPDIVTNRNQVIRHVYRRRKDSNNRVVKNDSITIFAASQSILGSAKGERVAEHEPAISDSGLRRSPRIQKLTDGCKVATGSRSCNCCKDVAHTKKKVTTKTGHSRFNIRLPIIVADISFPSMDDLLNHSDKPYPKIPVPELQRVAMDLCEMPPEDVTAELLLKEGDAEATDSQMVPNGSQQPMKLECS